MTLQQALKILKSHNNWRKGLHDVHTPPKSLTAALDVAVKHLEEIDMRPLNQGGKPLSEIVTNEGDAIEVAKIVWPKYPDLQTASNGGDYAAKLLDSPDFGIVIIKVYQYLQSRGYHLPVYYPNQNRLNHYERRNKETYC